MALDCTNFRGLNQETKDKWQIKCREFVVGKVHEEIHSTELKCENKNKFAFVSYVSIETQEMPSPETRRAKTTQEKQLTPWCGLFIQKPYSVARVQTHHRQGSLLSLLIC